MINLVRVIAKPRALVGYDRSYKYMQTHTRVNTFYAQDSINTEVTFKLKLESVIKGTRGYGTKYVKD